MVVVVVVVGAKERNVPVLEPLDVEKLVGLEMPRGGNWGGSVHERNVVDFLDDAGRKITLKYRAEMAPGLRIHRLDDEDHLLGLSGDGRRGQMRLHFSHHDKAHGFHGRLEPGDVVVGGPQWLWSSQNASTSPPPVMLRVIAAARPERRKAPGTTEMEHVVETHVADVKLTDVFRNPPVPNSISILRFPIVSVVRSMLIIPVQTRQKKNFIIIILYFFLITFFSELQ